MNYAQKLLSSVTAVSLALGILMTSPLPVVAGQMSQPQSQSQATKRIIYGSPKSPFAFKVLVAMDEKGLDFNFIETLPMSALRAKGLKPSPEFMKASPLGKIPAYQEGDWSIADSTVITAYLDLKNPENPLYPSEPEDYAETRWFEKYGDEVLAGVTHHKILFEKIVKPKLFGEPTDEKILQDAINKDLPPLLDYLEKELKGKQWIAGNNFTAADIAIGTHLVTLKQCGVDISKWPTLTAYAQKLFDRPSFKKYMKV